MADEIVTENAPKGNTNWLMIAAVVVIVAVGGIAFFLKGNTTTPTNNTTQETEQSTTAETTSPTGSEGTAMESNVKTFTVTGSNFSFSPKEIRVKQGDKVKITFVSQGGNHDFMIDEFNVKTPIIGSGATADVEFTADKAGTFEFYCSVGTHRAMGMVGNLVVE